MIAPDTVTPVVPRRSEKSKNLEDKLHLRPEELRAVFARPVAYHRLLAIAGGTVSAGVFLSQLIYWSERTDDPSGWVYKTIDDWWNETALGRYELQTIRKALVKENLIEERLSGVPARLYYKLNWDALGGALSKAIRNHQEHLSKRGAPKNQFVAGPQTSPRQSSKRQCHNPVCGIATNKDVAQPQTIIEQRVLTESTPENTKTKTCAREQAKDAPSAPGEASSSSFSFEGNSFQEPVGHRTSEEEAIKKETATENPLPVAAVLDDGEDHTEELALMAADFGITEAQKQQLAVYAKRDGIDYVREKADVTCSEPRDNLARTFMAALKGNWQQPKTNAKPKPVTYSEPEEWAGVLRRLYPDADHEAYSSWPRLPQSLQEEVCRAIYDNPALVAELKAERKAEAKRQKEKLDRLKQVWLSASDEQRKRWLSGMSEATREVWTPKAGRDPSMFFLSALEKVLDAPAASPMEQAA
jgi:hypothetical protein